MWHSDRFTTEKVREAGRNIISKGLSVLNLSVYLHKHREALGAESSTSCTFRSQLNETGQVLSMQRQDERQEWKRTVLAGKRQEEDDATGTLTCHG